LSAIKKELPLFDYICLPELNTVLMDWNFDDTPAREGTNSIKYDLRKETFGKSDLIPLWVADMDFNTPGFIIDSLKRRLEHDILGYSFRPLQYYSSIIDWQAKRHNWKIEKEWITFCPGIVPALNICTLAFTSPGDSIVVQPPVYFPFFSAVESHGRKLIYNHLSENNGEWEMDFEELEKIAGSRPKMIIISNPHNPVGRAWSREELTILAEKCLRNNILILSDEIHCDLLMPQYNHVPLSSLSEEIADITITCIAPSKTFNLAGLSTSSVIISNPSLRKNFSSTVEKLHISGGNIFGTEASIAAYTQGEEWLNELVAYINSNALYITEYCRVNIPEILPVRLEATYLLWLDCRKFGMSGKELQDFFINRAGVGMNEGSTFGPGGEGFMRMNIACPKRPIIKALEQIEAAVSSIR
jgi:cystathionine beta-lyase